MGARWFARRRHLDFQTLERNFLEQNSNGGTKPVSLIGIDVRPRWSSGAVVLDPERRSSLDPNCDGAFVCSFAYCGSSIELGGCDRDWLSDLS